MFVRFTAAGVIACLVCALTSFGAAPAQAQEKLKVGFVYIGPVGDHGWTYEHNRGRLAIDRTFGDRVETVYVENVPEGPEAGDALDDLVAQGARLVFTTSWGYGDATVEAARRYPEVRFEHATGVRRMDNLSVYSPRFYEGRYVTGQIAAAVSKTGRAGYIASFPIPEVVRCINAFMLGAQSVDPGFRLDVEWAFTWYDPVKEAEITNRLIRKGADVLTQHTDSTAPMKIADDRGLIAFGKASDMLAFGPNSQASAIVNNWGPYYVARTRAVLDGVWESKQTWDGLGAGMVQMSAYANVPDEVAEQARRTEQEIASGQRHVFQGPLYRQDGTLAVGEGRRLSDAVLHSMDWYVRGIDGELPK